jgi:hypothetical protein
LESAGIAAFETVAKPKSDSRGVKIARALSAAPTNIATLATVVDRDQKGNEIVLREGTNGFTCFPRHPNVVGESALCAKAPALQSENNLAEHHSKPIKTTPGIEEKLAGGTDGSATDPKATSGAPLKQSPHWMILWPFDPATTGLPRTPE